MSSNGYSWWDFFLQILSFFIGKKKEEKRQEEQQKTSEELKIQYDNIDQQKKKEQKNDLEDRMHNLFK